MCYLVALTWQQNSGGWQKVIITIQCNLSDRLYAVLLGTFVVILFSFKCHPYFIRIMLIDSFKVMIAQGSSWWLNLSYRFKVQLVLQLDCVYILLYSDTWVIKQIFNICWACSRQVLITECNSHFLLQCK